MSEVINISLSQRANHVTTHLYNTQESHIPYSRTSTVKYTNSTYLTKFKNANNQTNYSPRCLIYDSRQGFGQMNKFEYHEPPTNLDHLQASQIISKPDFTKNQYQTNLDSGKPTRDLLDIDNTKYWTDYNKLILNPRNLHTLQNYNLANPSEDSTHKYFENLKFSSFPQGTEEYKSMPDTTLDDFRRLLEQCDSFHGLNVVTDLDNAWGGFTSEYMTELVDEYFNNGNKHNLWTYAIMSKTKLTSDQMCSRIKSFIEVGKHSTLFFPIQAPEKSSLLNDYHSDSLWHTSAVSAMFIDSMWSINNQIKNPIPMDHLESNITRGYNDRKYVNEIKINVEEDPADLVSNVDINAYYTMAEAEIAKEKYISLGLNDLDQGTYFSKSHITTGTLEPERGIPTTVYTLSNQSNFCEVDSTPDIFSSTNYSTEFNTSTAFSKSMKTYKKFIYNVRSKAHLQILEDKHEVVEELDKLIQEYTIGYDSESEDDD